MSKRGVPLIPGYRSSRQHRRAVKVYRRYLDLTTSGARVRNWIHQMDMASIQAWGVGDFMYGKWGELVAKEEIATQ